MLNQDKDQTPPVFALHSKKKEKKEKKKKKEEVLKHLSTISVEWRTSDMVHHSTERLSLV